MKKLELLKKVEEEVANCRKCPLYKKRIKYAIHRGNIDAKLVIIGEALGKEESEQGKPFVGKAGKLLDKILNEVGLNPEKDVYICNILKDRPSNNRKPFPNEVEACFPFLEQQIEIIKPEIIVTLGATSTDTILGLGPGIIKRRVGRGYVYKNIPVIPTVHPSAALRRNEWKEFLTTDLELAKNSLNIELQWKEIQKSCQENVSTDK